MFFLILVICLGTSGFSLGSSVLEEPDHVSDSVSNSTQVASRLDDGTLPIQSELFSEYPFLTMQGRFSVLLRFYSDRDGRVRLRGMSIEP